MANDCKASPEWMARARKQLTYDEGKTNKPYRCPAGKLTIGVGRNIEDSGISDATVDQMLDEDITKARIQACEFFGDDWHKMKPERQLGIPNMIFNMGIGAFKRFKKMIAAILANDSAAIKVHGQNSLWFKQVKNRGPRVLSLIADNKDTYPGK